MVAVLASVCLVGEAEKAGLQRRIRQFVKLGAPSRAARRSCLPPRPVSCRSSSKCPSLHGSVAAAFLHGEQSLPTRRQTPLGARFPSRFYSGRGEQNKGVGTQELPLEVRQGFLPLR